MLIDLSRRLPDWSLAALAGASEFRAFGRVSRNQTWITVERHDGRKLGGNISMSGRNWASPVCSLSCPLVDPGKGA